MRARKRQSRDKGQVAGSAGQRGFTLLEVLVAVTILTIGLLALARMQSQAVRSNSFGNQLTEATFLAQDKAEELRLLNEQYLADITQTEPVQIQDTQNNWTDTDGDSIADSFDWTNPDHTNADGPATDDANPIDVSGKTVTSGGYTRVWCVADNVPIAKAKTIQVRVSWDSGRHQVTVESVLSH